MADSTSRPKAVWRLAEINLADVRDRPFKVAMLPLGATEPHNLHLPYGTDVLEATLIADQICEAATNDGGNVVLLPTLPFGVETNLRKFPLAINLNPSTLNHVIEDVITSITHSGIRKIVLFNSHGGNELKPLLRELYGKLDAHLFLCNWYEVIKDEYHRVFENPDDHAGEMETSFALAYFGALVARDAEGRLSADEGKKRRCRFDAVENGWIKITRPWHLLTTNSGAGNPHAATAEKGRQIVELLVRRIAPFLVELSRSPLDESFPF